MSKGTSQNKKKQRQSSNKRSDSNQNKHSRTFLLAAVVVVIVVAISAGLILSAHHGVATTSNTNTVSSSSANGSKPIILYVNQGNALVDLGNYSNLLSFAKAQHFNTIFFQVYRSGQLLFSHSNLSAFVTRAQLENLSIYFSLYFTSSTQQIPSSIYNLGENGINLDMSTLSTSNQQSLLSTLSKDYHGGKTAVTTTNFATTLTPDLLIFETYNSPADNQYIHPGIIASVEPYIISSSKEYQEQYQYALSNSDGVMVFDYYGLLKTGY